MPTIEILSKGEVESRRAELLASVGMSEGELRVRAAAYALTAHEEAVLAEIGGLEFLLGE